MRLLAAAALVCTVLALHCSAGSPSRKHLEANFNPRVPAGWTSRALTAAEYETTIDLTIALRNENTEALTELLEAVSDPRSASYGNYLTWKEVGALVAPSKQTVSTVLAWLHENNVSDAEFRGTGDFVRILLTIAEAERLLETSFVALASAADERPIYRSLSPYSVPAHVGASIDFVAGVYGTAGLVGEGVRVQAQRSALATDVTPAVVKSMTYSTGVVGSSPNNTISVAEFLDQYYSPSDLEQFQQQYDLTVQPVDVVDGPNDSSSPGLEAQLDIEYVMACGENIPTWFISTPGRHELQEPFLTWLQDMEATPNAPWIFSVSFGDVESTISADYASRCEQEFQKFGATGRTVFFASGDDGVGCSGCPDSATLEPNWPATSQYVTAVGGMRLQGDGGLEGDSIASGGFSNLFPQASWQADAVQAYISSSQMPANEVYNVTGRAVPDIAAFSESVRIVIDGFNMGIGGTSCAAPQVAGIFGLINDLRLQNGMPTMGFLNPWIYQVAAEHDDAFTDVTTGINSHECCTGFPAGPGWDPITGWGLPNYETLSQYALQA